MAIQQPSPVGIKNRSEIDLSQVRTVSPAAPAVANASGFETKSVGVPAPAGAAVSQFAGNAADVAANKAAYQAAHPAPVTSVQAPTETAYVWGKPPSATPSVPAAAAPVAPAAPAVPTPAPAVTAPAQTPAPSAPAVWTAPAKTEDVNAVITAIDPTGTMTADEKAQISSAFSSADPSSALKYAQMTAEQKNAAAKQILDAYRTKRDTTQRLAYDQANNEAQVQQQKEQYAAAMSAQRSRMDADQNNLATVLGTSGRLASHNAKAAAQNVLSQNETIYAGMVSARDNALSQLARNLQYSSKQISDAYNDSVSQSMQDALKKIEALDKTGAMNTSQGLIQARDYIDKVNSDYLQHTGNYVNQLTALNSMYSEQAKTVKEANTVNSDVTSKMNDGYLYNAQGGRVLGTDGLPVKVANSSGTLLTKEPITMNDGAKAFVYQNADGSTRVEKILGTEALSVDEATAQRYAALVSSGALKVEDLTKLGIPQSQLSAIVSKIDESQLGGAKASDFLKLQDADGNEYYFNPKTNQTLSSADFAKTAATNAGLPAGAKAGGTLDFTNLADQHPGEASFKNNNPAGITWHAASQGLKDAWTAAGVNFEMGTPRPGSEWGNYVKFATVVDGINAREIAMERKGGSVRQSLMQWVGTKNPATNAAYADSITKAAGIDGNKTYAQLTDAEKEALSVQQLKREAGGMYKEMLNRGYIGPEGFDYAKMEADAGTQTATGEAPQENQYTGVAKDIVDGTIKSSDLKQLGYKPSEIKQIEAERIRLTNESQNGALSTGAQRAVAAKSVTETGKEKTKVLNELQQAGVFDRGEGNQNYYEAKPDVKAEMPQFFTARDSFNEAKAIVEKHKAAGDLDEFLGSYDASQERMKSKTGAWTDEGFRKDFDRLDNLLGKELSQYMKNISGATVSEKEAERLLRQIPNLDMSETEFEQAMQLYEQSLKNASRYMVNQYGFADDATARKVVLGESSAPESAQPAGRWNPTK